MTNNPPSAQIKPGEYGFPDSSMGGTCFCATISNSYDCSRAACANRAPRINWKGIYGDERYA